MIELLLMAGASAFITNTIVNKSGPGNSILRFRNYVNATLKSYSPLVCMYCTGFWVTLGVVIVWQTYSPLNVLLSALAVASIASAINGAGGNY